MVAEIDRLRKANESLGGVFEVAPSASFPASARTCPGIAPGRPARAGDHVDPGGQGRVGRRGIGCRRAPGSEAHDEIFWSPSGAICARPTAPGGSRAGCRTASPGRRGALKPLPTLTKPLRSVDTETKEPAQALRERTDSTVVRRRAWWARRWSRSSSPALSREVRRRRDGRRARGPGGLPGADRMAAVARAAVAAKAARAGAQARLHRLHGRRQVDGRAAGRGRSLVAPRRRRALEARARRPDSDFLRPRGRGGVREREQALVLEQLDRPGGVVALGGAAVRSGGPRGVCAAHVVCLSTSTSTPPGGRSKDADGRWPATGRVRARTSRRLPLYESLATVVLADREVAGRRRAALPIFRGAVAWWPSAGALWAPGRPQRFLVGDETALDFTASGLAA